MNTKNVWEEIVDYARWSPSPHNVQPWKIKVLSETQAEIYYDPKRLLPVEDIPGRFITVGFGIFIEIMSVAAAPYGLQVKEECKNIPLNAAKDELQLFAKLSLVKRTDKEVLDRELIKSRRTSRLHYDGRKVPEEVLSELKKIAFEYDEEFTFSTDPKMIEWVLDLNRDTIFYDLEEKATRDEIGSWVRYSKKEAIQKKDGLWSYCMIVPGSLMYLFFKKRWIFELPLIKQFSRKFYLDSTSGTATIGWLKASFETPQEWMRAGHMLARLWLCMTKHGVYLHPFGSIITNSKSHKRMLEKFDVAEGKKIVWLLMRLGYSKVPPRSLRLEMNDILV